MLWIEHALPKRHRGAYRGSKGTAVLTNKLEFDLHLVARTPVALRQKHPHPWKPAYLQYLVHRQGAGAVSNQPQRRIPFVNPFVNSTNHRCPEAMPKIPHLKYCSLSAVDRRRGSTLSINDNKPKVRRYIRSTLANTAPSISSLGALRSVQSWNCSNPCSTSISAPCTYGQ